MKKKGYETISKKLGVKKQINCAFEQVRSLTYKNNTIIKIVNYI